jgi:hypothetical protein
MRKFIQPFIIALLLFLLWFKSCSSPGENKTIKVVAPEVKGTFKAVKPNQKTIVQYIELPTKGQKLPNNEEFLQNQINELLRNNEKLNDAYGDASDSLKKALYSNAIAIKSFNHIFDNDTINITANGLVRGEIQSIAIDYKIKSRTIEILKPKETFLRVMGGIEVGNTKLLDNFTTKATLGFQNRKGNIITFGTDTEKRIYVGYSVSIFNWKR